MYIVDGIMYEYFLTIIYIIEINSFKMNKE